MQADPQPKEHLSKKKWLTPAVEIISLGGGTSPTFHEATYFSGGPGSHHFAHTANHSPAPETLFNFFVS